MNELIKVNYSTEEPTVSARELHKFLEIATEFRHWFPRMCEYGFKEGIDYTPVIFDHPQNHQPTRDYCLTIPMAKEICMIQRTEKGKMARQYFLSIEKAWNTPEMVMSRALKMAEKQIQSLKLVNSRLNVENEIMRPKAEYFDELVDRNLLTNFRDTAKELKIKEKDFIKFLIDNKYIYRDKKRNLKPYADKNNGLFEIKESKNDKTGWVGTQTLITPKGRETFRLLIKGLVDRNVV
ncbi:antA/AntB antirepressor family protein [Clostridium sp. SYSU_GA19001]|uniref:antA/AntB antirepressor family protein n=1 Tax=Clostridium caldaquaticum TaxID=2940653 RepID=UPI0020775D34|nr:antA/AntB antirepressor family protein [Clostridium caldaquaticum]MCM8710875.1 antA/AntB antirepressor family protein [Clostridium caldaquaticum]